MNVQGRPTRPETAAASTGETFTGNRGLNMVYRAYRAPYAWVPQRQAPTETPIPRLERSQFRVQGAAQPGREREISVPGVEADQQDAAFCVAPSS